MKRDPNIAPKVYRDLLRILNNIHFTDKAGTSFDLNLLKNDWWLQNSAVSDRITRKNGQWLINLVFAHYGLPLNLLIRDITSDANLKTAKIKGFYMKRVAAKDQRGTLEVELDQFKYCDN